MMQMQWWLAARGQMEKLNAAGDAYDVVVIWQNGARQEMDVLSTLSDGFVATLPAHDEEGKSIGHVFVNAANVSAIMVREL